MSQTEFPFDPANGPHKEVSVQTAVMRTIAEYAPESDNPQDAEDHMLSVLLSLLAYNTRALGIPFEMVVLNVVKAYAHFAPKEDATADTVADATL